jgi:hypothetical protein
VGTIDNSNDEDYSRNTDNNEKDKDFLPEKQRKLPLVSTKKALKPAREHNPELDLSPSRSPFATAELVLAVEYEEWPLHGSLNVPGSEVRRRSI